MGLLDKLRGKDQSAEETEVRPECLHVTLVPHWDRAEDIGHNDRATSFTCEGCGSVFSQQETTALRESETDRLKSEMETEQAV